MTVNNIMFVAGDVVRLKSGGAWMTIAYVPHPELAYCVWHDRRHQPQSEKYRFNQLTQNEFESGDE